MNELEGLKRDINERHAKRVYFKEIIDFISDIDFKINNGIGAISGNIEMCFMYPEKAEPLIHKVNDLLAGMERRVKTVRGNLSKLAESKEVSLNELVEPITAALDIFETEIVPLVRDFEKNDRVDPAEADESYIANKIREIQENKLVPLLDQIKANESMRTYRELQPEGDRQSLNDY